jgi:hypothetical protein
MFSDFLLEKKNWKKRRKLKMKKEICCVAEQGLIFPLALVLLKENIALPQTISISVSLVR